ncbi:MAG: hypothetical protein HQM10_20935 [Candidatus Riflebacteria bacterium]|nr:hypothetical protein [Candidatus Riflebacteria bacterium]
MRPSTPDSQVNYSMFRHGNAALQWVLTLGILTFFLLPFVQLWSVQAVPLFLSDGHRQAAMAVENLLAEALSRPYSEIMASSEYKPLPNTGDISFEGKVTAVPHPNLPGMVLIRAHVRWGILFIYKSVCLEAAISQTRP